MVLSDVGRPTAANVADLAQRRPRRVAQSRNELRRGVPSIADCLTAQRLFWAEFFSFAASLPASSISKIASSGSDATRVDASANRSYGTLRIDRTNSGLSVNRSFLPEWRSSTTVVSLSGETSTSFKLS